MKRRFFAFIALCVTLSACAMSDLLNASITREGYRVHRDIAYGKEQRQTLDVYVPTNATNAPVIVFFYGGSWQFGSKDEYRFIGQAFASKGFVTVVADYRLYPDVYFPAFVNDGALAVKFTHEKITHYGGNPQKLFVAGHSAGAYIALMLAADPQYLAAAGGDRNWIDGMIGIAGPYDFLPLTDPKIKAIFSKYPDPQTQPINHITRAMPPVMLATGVADDVVEPKNSYHVKEKLERLHSPVMLYTYPDTGHIGIVLSLAEGFRGRTSLLQDISRFVNTTTNDVTPPTP